MTDVYTPNKTMDGMFATSLPTDTPVAYVPTPIIHTTDSDAASTSAMKEDQTTRQRYGVGTDAYSPSNPAIRIVKRKPKIAPEGSEASASNVYVPPKRRAIEDYSEDPAILALKTNPRKSILCASTKDPNRVKRRIFFADTRQLPLCHIKEIERIATIHSNVADFRCSERNEAALFGQEHDEEEYEEVEWCTIKIKGLKPLRTEMTESAKREEKRVADTGFMRGAMFGSYTLECIPELNDLAAADLANYRPVKIPTESVPSESKTISALHDLPLPGRYRQPQHQHVVQHHSQSRLPQLQIPSPSQYIPTPTSTYSQVQPQPAVIQQVFQETEPVNSYYTAAVPETKPEPVRSSFALPDNLKEMLAKLKQKGFVKSEDSEPTAPTDGFAAAVQTAQQMMSQQQPTVNTYSCEEPAQDYPMDAYVGTFATPEVQAQGRCQDSRNAEGWTQSGWKIPEPCVYFVNRPGGCNRGDQCRFLHDEELRRKTMAELPPRSQFQHDGFRSRGRGGFRGAFRGNQHQQDRDFREQAPPPPRVSRFSEPEPQGYRGGRSSRFGQHQSRFDQKGDIHQSQQNTQQHHQFAAQPVLPPEGSSPPKRTRVSRFDQPEEPTADVDLRVPPPQRRNRFDEGRPHRSRFDQPAMDRDDRTPQ